ncbi:MAG: aspartate--ammonia ligase [Epulopiscium sp. Nuni2H_MBin001]|nr:MAG: aspartate--ammonia ligase [Epulopiscium sp. Nuni2H_MBin001]
MQKLVQPINYEQKLSLMDTEIAIKLTKDTFERELAKALHLTRVSAPLFILPQTGLNDDLNGVERPVAFDIQDLGQDAQVVQSLAKWKRLALKNYGFVANTGLYTDMNAIRRDEEVGSLHSLYVDQWDWEMIITPETRTVDNLQSVVKKIWQAYLNTKAALVQQYPQLNMELAKEISFITSQELEDMYPNKTPREREDAIAKEKGAIFIMQIGDKLASGVPHDLRAPDYDDWSLNGDIIIWYPVLDRAVELSSMGIRVNAQSLEKQLALLGLEERKEKPFHKMLLNGELPLTLGGGIGQSRICMTLLEKAHVGEVQASIWPQQMIDECEKLSIVLL